MKRTGLIIIGTVVILVGTYAVYRSTHPQAATVRYVTATAQKGTLVSTVTGSGNIVVDQITKVNPAISGTITNLSVKLGDHVKKGQAVYTIVNDGLDVTSNKSYISYLQAKQSLFSAQSQLTNAQNTYTNALQDSGQAKAQVGLDQADQNLLSSQTTLTQDQSVLAASSSDASNYSTLQNKVLADQAALVVAQDSVNAAAISLQQSKNSSLATIQAAKQSLDAATANVETTKKTIETSQADYVNQKNNANLRNVIAPLDGTITTLSISNGDQVGTSSTTTTAPLVIADLTTLKPSVQINEVDAPKVTPGQKVTMTFDAIDGLTLTGIVEKIDTVGTVTQGVVTYTALVDFDSLDARIRPGMSVTSLITISVKHDVITVPNSAIKSQAGSTTVQVLPNGIPTTQDVQIGSSNDTSTEVTSGLNDGDTVVTQTIITPAKTTAASSISLPGLGGSTRVTSGARGGN